MTCLLGSLCDGGRSLSEAGAELRGRFAMTEQAERADVVEVALTSSLGDGKDVIGIPQAAARSFTQFPFFQKLPARTVIQLAKILAQRFSIEAAPRTDAAITGDIAHWRLASETRRLTIPG